MENNDSILNKKQFIYCYLSFSIVAFSLLSFPSSFFLSPKELLLQGRKKQKQRQKNRD